MDVSDEDIESNSSSSSVSTANGNVTDDENLVIILGLPFEINNNKKINDKANYYYNILLNLKWEENETCDIYLQKIISEKCKYFNINNYAEIATNTIITKHIVDIRCNIKENIKSLITGDLNKLKCKIDLLKMIKTHKTQIASLNRTFIQRDINPHISHAEQYYKYVMRAFGNQTKITDKNNFTLYSIKIEIELESEIEQSKILNYEWQCQMYEEIMLYYENN
jgi:hypothetical protein